MEAAETGVKKSLSTSKKTIKRQVNVTDTYVFNENFRSPMKKIQFNAVQKKESRSDSEKIFERVLLERKFVIDGAIIKIMKTKKALRHGQLITEVMSLLRFNLEV